MLMWLINILDAISEALWDYWNRRTISRMKRLSGKVPDKNYGQRRELR